ncbi:serine aminopeptidase domain-containing protein [Pseudidiomarina sp.]|uniref:alpha/beta hydrolase family protein n=1 Tax=Pseudidiomarina sp. TaxID=2081707 RepID=UPI00299DA240|nr:alpha/beta hydrolase [Pseudidiomarina sp.]MDX1706758.1 alpha/beta hydrolase [Pseudidiomarina sp.]
MSQQSVSEQSISVAATSERQLALTRFSPDNTAAAGSREVIIMAPAMAVPQTYYHRFCNWLASQGFEVYSFDYFGIGASRDKPLRQVNTNLTDWAYHDCPAVIDYVYRQHPQARRTWFAHSVGGQLFGLIPNHHHIDHVITVASGTGFWRENTRQLRPRAWVLWHLIVPWLVPLCGYFPGNRLGIIGDLPGPAMQQWRRWCLNPDYLVGVEGQEARAKFAAVSTPITSLSFSDDELLTQRNIHHLHDFYTSAPQQRILLKPVDFDLDRIGHFGVFSRACAEVWPQMFGPHLRSCD